MNTYAYARVSARDQNLERQLTAFSQFGIEKKRIYADRKSGKDFDRTQYRNLLKKLKRGDLLVVSSIDRLGRNYDAIRNEWAFITGKVGADILVLDMPLLDTRDKSDSLIGKFISDIVLQVLSFVAQNERENIKARQAEGIRLAKSNGVRFGRPQTDYSERFLSVAQEFLLKRMTAATAMRILGLRKDNFYYHIRRIKTRGL